MHIATMLGNKFSIIDFTETHNMFYYDLVVRHRFTDRCASIRNINFYHGRPSYEDASTIDEERDKALRGEASGGHHLRMLGRLLAPIVSAKAFG
jgi:Asp/Glu/hydantoin racemase